ncbi:hypothetical protein [Agrobacterium tumefaciens]|uniref:hypothetical protein n=1 Tax=Agrobacterium tumefaciens TaxID=358 RepID=UPI000470F8BA
MFDYFSIAGFRLGLDAFKGGWRLLMRNNRRLTPTQKLELRLKWQPEFEKWFYTQVRDKLDPEIVIRDLRQMDVFPDIPKNPRGAPAWFRTLLIGTYERGIIVSLAYGNLMQVGDKWRHADHKANEKGPRCVLAGFIPYDFIDGVNWQPDLYYSSPNVFCYFDGVRRRPFEKVMYCQQWDYDGSPQVRELGGFHEVRKLSRKLGVRYFS